MQALLCVVSVCALVASSGGAAPPPTPPPPPFRFGSVFTSNMVLQARPSRAVLWGYTNETAVTVVSGTDVRVPATVASIGPGVAMWRVTLPALPVSFTPRTIEAAAGGARIALHNVLLGSVIICSGQSNMAYSVNGSNGNAIVHPPVNDSLREIRDMAAERWTSIRLYRPGQQSTPSPMRDFAPTGPGGSTPAVQGWTEPCPTIDGVQTCRVDFSSMCWFTGRDISAALAANNKAQPIGLVGTYWGGTADELWSSPDALRECLDPSKPVPVKDSQLWNGMMFPLVNMTVGAAVWYQGEANSHEPGGRYDGYNCTLPAMIRDWRTKLHEGSGGETSALLPFGIVQLNSIGNGSVYNGPTDPTGGDPLSPAWGYAGLRHAQELTAESVPNTFIATSVDTPDRPYPFPIDGRPGADKGFNVHSPFKQPTASRLARGALAVVYGITVDTVSPRAASVEWATAAKTSLVVHIESVGSGGTLELRTPRGFEVLVGADWASVPAVSTTRTSVTLDPVPPSATKLRYNWYSNPCGLDCFGCAVYVGVQPIGNLSGQLSSLPLPPFFFPEL